jgi:hypothetical protein
MPSPTPQQRIFWTQHQGAPYLMLDFSHATVAESLALMDHFSAALKDQAPLSVRMLTDVTEAQYEPSVANKWKAIRIQHDPTIKASAIYGLNGLVGVGIRAFLELLDMLGLNRGQKKLRIFKTRESALAWLMKA